MPTIYNLINDKIKGLPVETYFEKNEKLFKEKNEQGMGVYFSVNEFSHSRKEDDCTKLRYTYADFDIAKAGDGQTRKQKQDKKQILFEAMMAKCEPTLIIDTSNGLQPLWAITDNEPTEENKIKYKKVLKGIVAWSKMFGSAGDNVYDVPRILRLPGYKHQKEEPFLCEIIYQSKKQYTLAELELIFPFEEIKKEIQTVKVSDDSNPVFKAIEQLDFQTLIIKAFASVGRPVSFNKSGQLLDPVGGTTGTFLGRKGERDYLASSSHEPFKGNRITAVAEILKVSYSDAYQWITREYNLDFKQLAKQEASKKRENTLESIPVKKDYKLRYTWGTRELDTSLAIIKRGNFIVAAAKSGSGKTTFVFDMACKNALLGHKVLFLSLEMDGQDIKEDFGRKYSGTTIEEELDYKIPEFKQKAFQKKIDEINSIDNLKIKGMRRSGEVQWEDIEELIKQNGETDLVFIDNLDLIASKEKESDLDRQKRIVKSILNFTDYTKIPLVLIHHYRKSMAGAKDKGLDEMSGSGKIRDGADRIIKITRNNEPEATYPEKYGSVIFLQKGRGYPEIMKTVYFIKGTFVDIPPPEGNLHLPEEIQLQKIAEDFGGHIINFK